MGIVWRSCILLTNLITSGSSRVNHSHPDINMHILNTVLYTNLKLLIRRLSFLIVGDHFPYSCYLSV